MIKNVEFKRRNNEVLQETNLARIYNMPEKIVKESEDFEGKDSGWTLDEILRLEVRTNRYSPFRGSSSFIEVAKQIAETKAIINKKDSQCFMWSILAALYPNKTSSYVPHINKLNFDGISFPTPLNEIFENFRKICMQTYKLDPCWYFTTPALSWDAMLLHTKVAIELFTDYDMLLFTEKGVRGDESDVGYILEVDLEYPSDLHDKHSYFPLAPENKPPT
ncbi:uncharacterized protein TNIN_431301 [Trichonephila inaurata madagascariensis]|uniref:Uncharacterized protein n=1 Tax=Trichonephila inaurata madagascariensis TaxID=2747483 RepID=A0A8X6YBS7_9ARAC|nr:uncharacterized protein TNIN_431301 [Trichonephila inaurata madagascariensis]